MPALRTLRPVGLHDLPEARREALLWHFAMTLDYYGVDDLVRETSAQRCPIPSGPTPASHRHRIAVLGSDGRYHLLIDGHPICARTKHPRRTPSGLVWRHEDWCHWWTDGTLYRRQPPPRGTGPPATTGLRRVRWYAALSETTAAPELIEQASRCQINVTLGAWPRYLGEGSRMSKLITTLIDALGPDCHACGHDLGVYVDHDPFSGYTRGLTCIFCNSNLDACPHPTGCRWADYLNSPPAFPLRLRYPKLSQALRGHQRRIDYLGIDPFTHPRPPRSPR